MGDFRRSISNGVHRTLRHFLKFCWLLASIAKGFHKDVLSTEPDSGWWSYRKDAAHSANYRAFDVDPPLVLVWEHLYPPEGARVPDTLVFGPGRVYLKLHTESGSRGSQVVAIRLSDGHEEWSFTPTEQDVERAILFGPPVVANGSIYAAFLIELTESLSSTVRVYALDGDGHTRWSTQVATPDAQLGGTMTAAHGLLLLCTTEGATRYLVGLHQDTGTQAWRVQVGPEDTSAVRGALSPVVLNNDMILIAGEQDLRALRFDPPGEEVWRFTYPRSGVNGTPVPVVVAPHDKRRVGLSVVVRLDAGVVAVEVHVLTHLGVLLGTTEVSVGAATRSSFLAAPWRGGPPILVADDVVRRVSGSGTQDWSTQDPDGRYPLSPPALTTDFLFYTNSRRLHVFRIADGAAVWSDDSPTTYSTTGYGGVAIDQGFVAVADSTRLRLYKRAP